MKIKFRAVALFLALLLTALVLTSCTSGIVYASPRASKVVATAGQVEILYEELYFIAMNRIAELKEEHGENALEDEARVKELEDFVWERLLTRETALVAVGYDYGLNVLKGDISENVQSSIDSIIEDSFEGDRDAYIESLAKSYMTDRYVRCYFGIQDYLANAIVMEMLYRKELETDDAVVLDAIESDAFIRTIHVFVDKTNQAYSQEEHLAHANQVQATVAAAVDSDARYTAMCQAIGGQYNYDFGDPLGNGYYFTRGEMEVAYEEAAFALEEWGVSPVITTDEGYYIIMRLPKDADYIQENFETLKGKSYYVTLNAKVEEKLSGMSLVKTKFGEELDMRSLPQIDPKGGNTLLTVSSIVALSLIAGGVTVLCVRLYRRRKAK